MVSLKLNAVEQINLMHILGMRRERTVHHARKYDRSRTFWLGENRDARRLYRKVREAMA